jgi:hypothetical protein
MYSSWCQPVTGLCIFGQVLARCKGATVIKEREGSNSIVVIAIQAVVGVNFRTYVREGTYTFERDVCNELGIGEEVHVEWIFFICV